MENLFKLHLPPPKEKAKQLKDKFGDKAIEVVREMYLFGSANGLREELMYLNKVESELCWFDFNILSARLKKIGVELKISGNYPWVYLDEICGKKVKENKDSEHGWVIGYRNNYFKFSDTKELFKLIRKYK
jgi:hypothetical protein